MAFFQTCFRVESGFLSFLEVFRDAEHNGKCLRTLTFTVSEILHSILSKHIFAYKVALFHCIQIQ